MCSYFRVNLPCNSFLSQDPWNRFPRISSIVWTLTWGARYSLTEFSGASFREKKMDFFFVSNPKVATWLYSNKQQYKHLNQGKSCLGGNEPIPPCILHPGNEFFSCAFEGRNKKRVTRYLWMVGNQWPLLILFIFRGFFTAAPRVHPFSRLYKLCSLSPAPPREKEENLPLQFNWRLILRAVRERAIRIWGPK